MTKCPNNCGTTLTEDVLDPNDDLFKHWTGWFCKKCDIIYSEMALLLTEYSA